MWKIYLNHYFNQQVCLSIYFFCPYVHISINPSQKVNFAQSTNVTDECFRNVKDHLGITPDPQGICRVEPKVGQTKKSY